MDTQKLKMKIGEHEFEAEGPTEIVQSQFAAFKELITAAHATPKKEQSREAHQPQTAVNNSGQLSLEKIVHVDGRVISLTASTNSVSDAAMVILLAQRMLRNNETVTSSEVVDGLRTSGHVVVRVDSVMDKLATDGHVIKIGARRATRYRLTNQGVTRAQEIARGVISLVA
jgi:hypothetical protein